jgi:hypothetical protein
MDTLLEFLRRLPPIPWRDLFWSYGLPFVLGSLAAGVAYLAARASFLRRDFLHRVNFSLNYVDDNQLRLRTLKESDLDQIILNNRHGRKMLLRAARNVSDSDKAPFLDMGDDCGWLVLNAILNEISELLPTGPIAKSLGLPVRSAWYLFGVTCESDDDVKMRKIRVMIIAEELLRKIDQFPMLKFQHPWHRVRYQTLLKMRQLHHDDQRQETAEQEQRLKRQTELAQMPEKRRQREQAKDQKAAARQLPVRHLMRVELTLPLPPVPAANYSLD